MNQSIKTCILAIHKAPNKEVRQDAYRRFLTTVYESEKLFIALDKRHVKHEKGSSYPICLTKDHNQPSYYLFTDLENAKRWADHYQNILSDGTYPIAELLKEDYDYFFQFASLIQIKQIMMDEGSTFCCFDIEDLITQNKIPDLPSKSKEDIKRIPNCQMLLKILEWKESSQKITYLKLIRTETGYNCVYHHHLPKGSPETSAYFKEWIQHVAHLMVEHTTIGKTALMLSLTDLTTFVEKNFPKLDPPQPELQLSGCIGLVFKSNMSGLFLEQNDRYPNYQLSQQDVVSFYILLLAFWMEESSATEVQQQLNELFGSFLKKPIKDLFC